MYQKGIKNFVFLPTLSRVFGIALIGPLVKRAKKYFYNYKLYNTIKVGLKRVDCECTKHVYVLQRLILIPSTYFMGLLIKPIVGKPV